MDAVESLSPPWLTEISNASFGSSGTSAEYNASAVSPTPPRPSSSTRATLGSPSAASSIACSMLATTSSWPSPAHQGPQRDLDRVEQRSTGSASGGSSFSGS